MFDKERFSELLKNAIGSNRSITDFSKQCNVARPYISKFLNCKLDKAPSPEIIKKIAASAANDVSEVHLLLAAGYELNPDQFISMTFPEGPGFDDDYDNFVDEKTEQVRTNLNSKYKKSHNIENLSPIKVPIVSYLLPYDTLSFNIDTIYGYECIMPSLKYDYTNCFYYKVDDTSMINSRIYPSDLVFIIPNKPYSHNDLVLILKDDETYIRRYKKLNNLHLFQAENNDFDSFAVTNGEFKKSNITVIGIVDHLKTNSKL